MLALSFAQAVSYVSLSLDKNAVDSALHRTLTSPLCGLSGWELVLLSLWLPQHQHICWCIMSQLIYSPLNWCGSPGRQQLLTCVSLCTQNSSVELLRLIYHPHFKRFYWWFNPSSVAESKKLTEAGKIDLLYQPEKTESQNCCYKHWLRYFFPVVHVKMVVKFWWIRSGFCLKSPPMIKIKSVLSCEGWWLHTIPAVHF